MRILLTGATGFVGAPLREALLARGHLLRCVGRRPPQPAHPRCEWRPLDFARATTPEAWAPLLQGCDAALNAVGVFRETAGQGFEALHARAPAALFAACAAHGVRRVVQVSALGADERARTAYHLSKRAADQALLALPLQGWVAQPSLVFGPQGASSRMFLALASAPLLVLPAGGVQPVQPIHRDDVVEALLRLLCLSAAELRDLGPRVALVGPRALSLADYLQELRRSMGLPAARVLSLPPALADAAARLGDRLPGAWFDSASWAMLQQGNAAPARDTGRLLGRAPRDVRDFVPATEAASHRTEAQLRWLLPLLRGSIAAVWFVTAAVSAGLYPVADSYSLLARAGVPHAVQPLALYGAAALDLLLGVLTLWPVGPGRARLPSRRAVWRTQAVLILVYTAIISVRLPEFWLHPYGPLVKNLPLLAMLLLLDTLEPPAQGRRGAREKAP